MTDADEARVDPLSGNTKNENRRDVAPEPKEPLHDADRAAFERAFALAEQVAQSGNVPVGAAITRDGAIIAGAGNLRETLQDPTAHAELLALREASLALGRWRLDDVTLYVTLEPCAMCAGAIVQARVGRVVYAATEPKTGAHLSQHRLFDGSHTRVEQQSDLAERSARLLATFFEGLRARP